MTQDLELYWSLVDALREQRRLPGWSAEMDRRLLERIDEVFERLDDTAEAQARAGTWRGWPDQFDAKFERALSEAIDPELGAVALLPRNLAA